MTFPSHSKASMFEKKEYFQCLEIDGTLQEFKLEIPSFFKSSNPILYYKNRGLWTKSNSFNVNEEDIAIWDWEIDGCSIDIYLSRLKDINNKVYKHIYYTENCGSRKDGDLYYRSECKFHEK